MKNLILIPALTLATAVTLLIPSIAQAQTTNLFRNNAAPLQAQFTENENGKISRGTLTVGKNGQVRWERQTPYRETIVSNGRSAWAVDYGLNQATRLDPSASQELSLALNGKIAQSRNYTAQISANAIVLAPKDGSPAPGMRITTDTNGFPVRIDFTGHRPHTIQFSGWTRKPNADFNYAPAKGMEIDG